MTVFPPCSYRKCSSVLPCLIGMSTFGFQHSQISLSCLAELTVALHLLSGNTRSDSPFLNTDAKMERTEEIVSKTVHERETDLSIHCCHFSIWQKDFGWLVFFKRGKVVNYSHPYFAWVDTPHSIWLFVAETRCFSLLLFRLAPAVSARAENFSEQWLSVYAIQEDTAALLWKSVSKAVWEQDCKRKRERQSGRVKNKKLVFLFLLWQICILGRNMSYYIWKSAIHMNLY